MSRKSLSDWMGPMRAWVRLLILGFLVVGMQAGCPNGDGPGNGNGGGTDGNDNGGGTDGGVTGDIITLSTNRTISEQEDFLSILYTLSGAPTDGVISSFYVPVTGTGPDSYTETGPRVTITTGLMQGENQAFSFVPSVAGVGVFRVGLDVNSAAGDDIGEVPSDGTIRVEGAPNPKFVEPIGAITIPRGEPLFISFDAGDPENKVQWRLFHYQDGDSLAVPADEFGIFIKAGIGNVGQETLDTADLDPGRYQLGLSAVDTGDSIITAVDRGDEDRIVTNFDGPTFTITSEDTSLPPTITFTAPGMSNVSLFGSAAFTLQFSATIGEPGATGSIDLFYDNDRDPANRTTFVKELPDTTTMFLFPNNLPEGTYAVGAEVRDGVNAPVVTYATGSITVARTATLSVTAPNTSLPIQPSTPGQTPNTIDVAWSTNVPPGAGTVDVFARTLGLDEMPFGPEIQVLAPTSTATRSAQFSNEISGLYQITVRITLANPSPGEASQIQSTAPQPVRVSSLPRILWVGTLSATSPQFDGAILEGVNFEDNAGASLSAAGDVDGDGLDDFLVGARYGKPFFTNPSGVGPGEAYLIYGRRGANRIRGVRNLNALGSSTLRGVTFAGIRTPQANDETDGMSSVGSIPDVDGDMRNELVFGFPRTNSRGHNIDEEQDGVVSPLSLATLEREEQFLRGGLVFVSSQNDIIEDPTTGNSTIKLDMVGQDFDQTCVDPEPDFEGFTDDEFYVDVFNVMDDPELGSICVGDCVEPSGGGNIDGNSSINYGFVKALARDYYFSYVYSHVFFGGARSCASIDPFTLPNISCMPLDYCLGGTAACVPFFPGLHSADPAETVMIGGGFNFPVAVGSRQSGFYSPTRAGAEDDDPRFPNQPIEPFGARIIGIGLDDRFGTLLTLTNARGTGAGEVIVSAPSRTARGILLGPTGGPEAGGEINGLDARTNANAGVAYLFPLRSLWTPDANGAVPPRPHQYIVGEASHCGGPEFLIDNISATRIAGFANDRITNILGVADYNGDGRNDFAIGAPDANGSKGRVYIAFRRDPSLEGDYVLDKLALAPNDPERLTGLLVTSTSNDSLGFSLAGDFDFNNDNVGDLVIGSPNALGGVGEVVILFGNSGVVSGLNGVSIQSLLPMRTSAGNPVAARIQGNGLDAAGHFGFNIANAGDIDGDGKDDLMVAAPGGTPRFDGNLTDDIDTLNTPGIDTDFDGEKDDVGGPSFLPDGVIDANDNLTNAGLVYVISSRNRLDQIRTCTPSGGTCSSDDDCPGTDACTAGNLTISVNQLGQPQLRGFMIAGRRKDDRLGGGDAGDTAQGGITGKSGRGRSRGLAAGGDIDGDGRSDILIGSILADPRRDANSGVGVRNGGEVYVIYSSAAP